MADERKTGGAAPTLWFYSEAEEAAEFYVSLLPGSRILSRIGSHNGRPVLVEFELGGTVYIAMNGNAEHDFNASFSISVLCADQSEVDRLWDALTSEGKPGRCGWLTDSYGISWQIVPKVLPELMSGPDPDRSARVMQKLMTMTKIDAAALAAA